MPGKTVKRGLQDSHAAVASDDGPIFSTLAELVDVLNRGELIRFLDLAWLGCPRPLRAFF